MEHGDQIKIAEWLKLKPAFLSRILSGGSRPSPLRSEELEKISGIPMRHWLLLNHEDLRILVIAAWEKKYIRMEGGKKAIVAERAGITLRHMDYLLNTDRSASRKLALRLEEITGIDKVVWVFGSKEERNLAWERMEERLS
jgi:hypothetical protein